MKPLLAAVLALFIPLSLHAADSESDIDVIDVSVYGGVLGQYGVREVIEEVAREKAEQGELSEEPKVVLLKFSEPRRSGYGASGLLIAMVASQTFDQQKHIIVGGLIGNATQLATQSYLDASMSPERARVISYFAGLLASATAAFAKEAYDDRRDGKRDKDDIAATVLGTGITFQPIVFKF